MQNLLGSEKKSIGNEKKCNNRFKIYRATRKKTSEMIKNVKIDEKFTGQREKKHRKREKIQKSMQNLLGSEKKSIGNEEKFRNRCKICWAARKKASETRKNSEIDANPKYLCKIKKIKVKMEGFT